MDHRSIGRLWCYAALLGLRSRLAGAASGLAFARRVEMSGTASSVRGRIRSRAASHASLPAIQRFGFQSFILLTSPAGLPAQMRCRM
jgi:hypothetical protein